jgi:hypothetical protein
MGTIRGRVINGTLGAAVAAGVEVTLIGIDGQAIALTESTTTGPEGEFVFHDLAVVTERLFGVYAEYQGVEYFSEGRQFTDQDIDLQVMVYETSSDTRTIHVDRLHLLFDFVDESVIEVMEVWVLSNLGDQTIVPMGDQEGIEFILPAGFRELRFLNEVATEDRFLRSERGFFDQGPLRPIEGNEIVFSFTLPYERRVDFVQPLSYPVNATVILMPENGPRLDGIGLQDLGVGDIGGARRRTYNLGPISAGDAIELSIAGKLSASGGEATQTDIIFGAVLFGAALITGGVWWYRNQKRGGMKEAAVNGIPSNHEALLRALAALDDDFEAGNVDEDEYRIRRQTLKQEIIHLMRAAHD